MGENRDAARKLSKPKKPKASDMEAVETGARTSQKAMPSLPVHPVLAATRKAPTKDCKSGLCLLAADKAAEAAKPFFYPFFPMSAEQQEQLTAWYKSMAPYFMWMWWWPFSWMWMWWWPFSWMWM